MVIVAWPHLLLLVLIFGFKAELKKELREHFQNISTIFNWYVVCVSALRRSGVSRFKASVTQFCVSTGLKSFLRTTDSNFSLF